MSQWHQFDSHQKAVAEALFVARSVLDGGRAENRPEQKIGFNELYRQVTQPNRILTPALQRALTRDRKLRDGFHLLLRKTARYSLPHVAAASTGPITVREVEGFRIRLKPSRVEPDQVFVIIELPDNFSFVPRTLFIYEESGLCQKHPLPAQVNGQMQLLTEATSELAGGIRNHKTEIFLQ
jgi:hypothetical protein